MKFGLISALLATVMATPWSVSDNKLHYEGEAVVLHGLGIDCTEYLLRAMGTKCFCEYNWNDPEEIITTLNQSEIDAMMVIFSQIDHKQVKPIVRIPLTASYWLGVSTSASSKNFEKYPNLAGQYRTLITNLVNEFTSRGVATIVDLHNNDDVNKQKLSLGGDSEVSGVKFWDEVSTVFGSNDMVFYELYNEPHITTDADSLYIYGDDTYAGMLELEAAVRKNAPDAVVIIGGAKMYAYDTPSLISLDKLLTGQNAIYNFHAYQGPVQAKKPEKNAEGFNDRVKEIQESTDKAMILTEFGQFCCDTDGECYNYPGTWQDEKMGYAQAILTIAHQNGISWLPWSWRPSAGEYQDHECQDVNAASDRLSLVHPTDGIGADWQTLWSNWSNMPIPIESEIFLN